MKVFNLKAEDMALYLGTEKISVCPAGAAELDRGEEELVDRGWELEGECLQSSKDYWEYYISFEGKTSGIEYNGQQAGHAIYFPDQMECEFIPLSGDEEDYTSVHCKSL
jgi:hypothetical protein